MKKFALLFFLAATICLHGQRQGTSPSISGNITAADSGCLAANCVLVTIPNDVSTATVQLSGTFSATVQFEVSPDFGVVSAPTWTAILGSPLPSGSAASSAIATGIWQFPVGGFTHFRARGSAYTSGTAVAAIVLSSGQSTQRLVLDSSGRQIIVGAAAAGSAVAGAPLLQGVSDGTSAQTVRSNCTAPGAQLTSSVTSLSGAASVELIALSGSTRIYICSFAFGNGGGTAPTLSLRYGTGTACATGTVTILPAVAIPAGTATPISFPNQNFFVTPTGQALCYILTGTAPTGTLTLTYLQQ